MTLFGSKYLFWTAVVIVLILLLLLLFYGHKQAKKRKVVNLAVHEFQLWNGGSTKENSAAMKPYLSKYWAAANAPDYGYSAAWSAAFISWLFKTAGAGDRFKYASSHSVYIRDAVQNRLNGVTGGAMIAYRPKEYKPKIGDLICYPRQNGVTFDTTHSYESHCDLVVDLQPGYAVTIGGNVSNSVSKTLYPLDKQGYVTADKVHAILKNAL